MPPTHDKQHRPRLPRGDFVTLRGGLLFCLAICAIPAALACSSSDGGGSGGTAGAGGTAGTAGAGGSGGNTGGTNPLDGIGQVELVADGFSFTEGPTWRVAEGTLLFSDLIGGNSIYELTPPDTIVVFRADSSMSNGLDSDADGLLLAAEHTNRRVSRTLANGTIVDVASEYEGNRLNSPNDIAVRSDGTIYFTDPPYAIVPLDQELDFNGVFRVDLTGTLTAEWEGEISTRPNGLVLSPDETILYVADTAEGIVAAFDVSSDGSLSNRRVFLDDVSGPDGMAMDTAGNLYVSASGGVEVYAPNGSLWGTIMLPDGVVPANCAFGGDDARTLYITARASLFQVRLASPGLY